MTFLRVKGDDPDRHVAYDQPVQTLVGKSSCKNCWGQGFVVVTTMSRGKPDRSRQLCYCARVEK